MRALLTALAATALVVMPAATSSAADGNPFTGPVGGARLGTTAVVESEGGRPPPVVKAGAWLIADVGTGEVLATKAPHAQLRPASTLKTLTSLVLLPRLDKTDQIVGKYEDAAIEGSKVGVHPGLTYSVELLFQGLFLASGNDAVHALSTHDEGGLPATIARMNATAAHLGAFDTHVTDPTGLDADGQLSSAYDLALFARAGLARPDFRRYASTKVITYPLADNAGRYQVANQNRLLFSYPGAIGVKTGYTTLARNTYIGAATRDGHTLVVTMLNSPHGVTADAATLLDWGFANRDKVTSIGRLVTATDVASARGQSPTPRVVNRARTSGQDDVVPPVKPPRGPLHLSGTDVLGLPIWLFLLPPAGLVIFLFRPKPVAAKARRARR